MLVFGAIAPHGGDILEEIADDPAVMAITRAAMQELGRRFAAAQPESVVILDPHGFGIDGAISIGATRYAAGGMPETPPFGIFAEFNTDLDLVEGILAEAAQHRIPMGRLVGNDNHQEAILPLRWGALIPLWYTAHQIDPPPAVVVLTPNRSLSRETLVRCGLAIARAAEASGKRVALIASCDQGHAHDQHGPYGFSPASAEHDLAMCEAIVTNDLPSLLDWPESFLEEAKVDAFWQTIMLAGALSHTPMHGELLSYEAPTYFGMAVAAYTPP